MIFGRWEGLLQVLNFIFGQFFFFFALRIMTLLKKSGLVQFQTDPHWACSCFVFILGYLLNKLSSLYSFFHIFLLFSPGYDTKSKSFDFIFNFSDVPLYLRHFLLKIILTDSIEHILYQGFDTFFEIIQFYFFIGCLKCSFDRFFECFIFKFFLQVLLLEGAKRCW